MSTYFASSKKYIVDQLLQKKIHSSLKGLCCISISQQELTLVYAREVAGKIEIELCESHPYNNKNNLLSILTDIVKNHQLKNVACSLMLQPEDYQLLITDELPVTPVEFQAAIRWKIKDLIHFPLDDVVIDSFLMPKMKTSQNKIMVVAAQASKLKLMSNQIRDCGLHLRFIDIPELGLRNINTLYEEGEKPIALIYVQDNGIQLLITSEQQIYVSRSLKFSLNTVDVNAINQGIERLAAEIQRSFDYYQSLWLQPIPSNFIFSSTKSIGSEAIALLSQKVKAPIEIINITGPLSCKPEINVEQQGKYLPVIGGVLRESTKNASRD
jgi:MSHA biogenesis protein MshI